VVGVTAYLVGKGRPAPQPPTAPAPESFTLDPPQPVLLASGGHQRFSLRVRRGGFRGPIDFNFSGLPPHVTIPDAHLLEERDQVEIDAVAEDDLAPGSALVTVSASGGEQALQAVLHVVLLNLPRGYEVVDPTVQQDMTLKPYYRALARRWPDGTRADFVLVRKARKADPDTFYMLADKVSVKLFRKFLDEMGGEAPTTWNADAGPDLPALGIGLSQAYRCARWLGGNLPTTRQWDKAAGLHDRQGRKGPFRGEWAAAAPLHIGVGRADVGPSPLAQAEDDVSIFGCRNMAGNGWEWTGTVRNGFGGSRRFGEEDARRAVRATWRGHSFKSPSPLLFEELLGDQAAWEYDSTEIPNDVGFRVVLEPD
jgi:hypothetical protein